MELEQIANRMEAAIHDGVICLNDQNTMQNGSMEAFLTEAFGVSSLMIRVNCFEKPTESKRSITLDGMTDIPECSGVTLHMLFLEHDQSTDPVIDIACDLTMPASFSMGLVENSNKKGTFLFNAKEIKEQYAFTSENTPITGTINAVTSLGENHFTVRGDYHHEHLNWRMQIALKEKELASLKDIATQLFQFFGITFSTSLLPDVNFQTIRCGYATASEKTKDELLLELVTTATLDVINTLSVRNIGLVFQTWDVHFSFAIRGDFVIGNTALPIILRYEESQFDLFVDTKTGSAKLPSIADVCSVAGIEVSQMFPIDFPDISLQYLLLSVPISFSRIDHFQVLASSDLNWPFFGLDALKMEKIEVGFELASTPEGSLEWGANLSGTISISDFPVVIYAYRKMIEGGWVFGARFGEDASLNINELVASFSDMLFGTRITLPIPDVEVRDTSILFDLGTYMFSASTRVVVSEDAGDDVLDKLFNIDAAVKITSTIVSNVRGYDLSFQGILMIDSQKFTVEYQYDRGLNSNSLTAAWHCEDEVSPLSLVSILQALGVSEVPDLINSFNLSIRSVDMGYDFAKSILTIKIVSDTFGSVRVDLICGASKTDYRIMIALKEDIRLSSLPVVGTYLHILDDISLEQIKFIMSSYSTMENGKTVKSGAALLGSICKTDFLLQIVDHSAPVSVIEVQDPALVLYDADGAGTSISATKWFTIEKSISVFSFHRIGVGYNNGCIQFLLDASLQTTPLSMSMMGLGIGFNVSDPLDISFCLSGLGAGFHKNDFEISGEFLKSTLDSVERYDGMLKLQFKTLSLFAIGSYACDALYVYALLSMPIGGPPAFFVTGLAAGFGYNEEIIIPLIDQIATFPLVAGAMGNMNISDMASKLRSSIVLSRGQYFLAAGVKFTSFRLVDAFALLVVKFGTQLEVALLGLAQLNVPFGVKDAAIVHAQLALKVSFVPESGLVAVVAQLTPESYLLSKECKLTGGFAFYVWFSGDHKGDFVLTLGGYHSTYHKPDHYPNVPKIGFSWIVDRHLSLKGESYFALTPSCIMAGGRFDATYQLGALKAWFIAKADFMICWEPIYYYADVSVSLGASYRVDCLFVHHTFTIELTASLNVCGPQFAGKAHIKWYIISFTITFGDYPPKTPDPILWEDFQKAFLPHEKEQNTSHLCGADDSAHVIVSSIQIANGLLCDYKTDEETASVVRPDELLLITQSAIPCTELFLNGKSVYQENRDIGVLPMGQNKKLKAIQFVEVTDPNNRPLEMTATLSQANMPNAMWGMKQDDQKSLMKDLAVGLQLSPIPRSYPVFPESGYIDLEKLSIYDTIERSFSWTRPAMLPSNPYKQENPIAQFSQSVMSAETISKRNESIAAMQKNGFLSELKKPIDLSLFAQYAEDLFDEDIFLGVLM